MNKIDGNVLIVDDDKDILTTAGMFLKQLTTGIKRENNPDGQFVAGEGAYDGQ